MIRTLKLAGRLLLRDWRAGELYLLALAIVIAVSSVTSVGFFTDRVRQVLEQQANELLGSDLLIASSEPIPADVIDAAQKSRLQVSLRVEFPSMVLAQDKNQLASLKAVSENYPLRGSIKIASSTSANEINAVGIPAPGTLWADAGLMRALNVGVGSVIQLGAADFKIAAILTSEPARAAGTVFIIAPTVIINATDLVKTQLIQPASRVRYNLLVAGDHTHIKSFRDLVEPKLKPGQRIEGIEDARPEIRNALERARQFLGLAALVSVMLAGVAIATATRRFITRHLDTCAIMRCFGAKQADVLWLFSLQIIALGLLAALLGCVLGYAGQWVLAEMLGPLVGAQLPTPSFRPVLFGMATGLLALLGFALPPLLHLRQVPTLRVLRRELGALPARSIGGYVLGLGALAILIVWQAGDVKLGVYMLAGMAATIVLLILAALLFMWPLRRLRQRVGVGWRFGFANIFRRPAGSMTQILAFGLGIMALLLLTFVRSDLMADWQNRLPPDTANRFLINIQPEQVAALTTFLHSHGFTAPGVYPMVRGRLVAINGEPVTPERYQDEHAKALVAREFNLSWSQDLAPDNEIVAGQWWRPDDNTAALSVEQGIAESLNIHLGDSLRYVIAENEFEAKVTNLRKVNWDTFRPNFFVIAPPGALDNYPASYISSFYLSDKRQEVLSLLLKQFPNITVIDVAAVMDQVRQIIERVGMAVDFVFIFTLLAGFTVMYAAIQATLDERVQEGAILRTLGAQRGQLLRGLIAEFAGIGLLAGTIAAAVATALSYALAQYVFHLPFSFNPMLWITGVVGGVIGVGLAGWLGTRFIANKPPLQTLQSV